MLHRVEILYLYKGILLSGLSSVFFSLCAVAVKSLHNIHPGQLAVHRFVSILLISLPIVIYKKEPLFGKSNEHLFLFLRSLAGSTNLFLNFLAYRYLPLGEASVIIFSVPVFVPIMAKIFLKEPCGLVQAVPALLTVVGLAIISDNPTRHINSYSSKAYDSQRMIGLTAALASVLLGSAIFIILRKLKQVDSTVVLFNFAWFGVLETNLLTYFFGEFTFLTCGHEPLLIVVFGIFSFLGQFLMTCATREEEASVVATLRSATDIILSFIWQFAFFKNTPNISSLFGAVLVSFSIFLVGIQKWQQVLKS
ncbi:Solute carrier family 35 member G1 like protein [Argiope bruennichi]|uniref:Solute carrier family 35 member G1 like protein n=1 Tax=Argiope bruennichi TaxID=94029 RepID=A0A8T0ECX2_ARGBR|nr:Solute carrier family 35 member G1 like protein [Argiope bruennichi]